MSTVATFLGSPDALGDWTLVPDRSTLTFANKSMWALMTVTGRFTAFNGHGHISATGAVSGQLNVKAASVDTGLRIRDKHLRSPDFFKADRFPEITVVVTDVDPTEGDHAELHAFITVTGTTEPLTLPVTVGLLDDGAIRVVTETTIDHDKLGVRWNKFFMISRKTTIAADTVFRHAPSTDAGTTKP